MNRAAAVLVTVGPRVLAFQRYDSEGGLSMPCGKIEEGESPAEAALREAYEETGLRLRLVNTEPYVGFDNIGNSWVHTFRAELAEDPGHLITDAPGEGRPCWASLREIVSGPYWHYNRRVLRHFGLTVPLVGKFHSHITVVANSPEEAKRAAKLTDGKLTVIDLSRDGRTQTDCMITHHYVTGHRGLEDQHDVTALLRARGRLLQESGIQVTRLKLEYDVTHERNDKLTADQACLAGTYTEVHVKCVVPNENYDLLKVTAAEAGWHPSRNPFEVLSSTTAVQFVNRRFYGSQTLSDIDAAVDSLLPLLEPLCGIAEVKYEVAVYDSNDEHDKWWAV